MFEILDTLTGAAIAGAFFLLGRRSKTKVKPVKPVEAICGCDHHRAYHKDDGPCSAQERRYNADRGTHYGPCGCQNYRGPKPYSQVLDEIEGA